MKWPDKLNGSNAFPVNKFNLIICSIQTIKALLFNSFTLFVLVVDAVEGHLPHSNASRVDVDAGGSIAIVHFLVVLLLREIFMIIIFSPTHY